MKFIIPIPPITKKNSQQLIKNKQGRVIPIPSSQYLKYEKECGSYIPQGYKIDFPINIKAIFYMPTRRKCDLVNLEEALCDVLVKYQLVEDDNYTIIASMDGSRVVYSKEQARTEVEITSIDPRFDAKLAEIGTIRHPMER